MKLKKLESFYSSKNNHEYELKMGKNQLPNQIKLKITNNK